MKVEGECTVEGPPLQFKECVQPIKKKKIDMRIEECAKLVPTRRYRNGDIIGEVMNSLYWELSISNGRGIRDIDEGKIMDVGVGRVIIIREVIGVVDGYSTF